MGVNCTRTKFCRTIEERLVLKEKRLAHMGVYECTFNDEGNHNHSQMALLYNLPLREDVRNWKKIKVLVAPPEAKNIPLNEELQKQYYLDNGFVETLIGTAPQCIKTVGNNIQAQQK
eukprot:845578-Ditylum_brightwellii.AAC.1